MPASFADLFGNECAVDDVPPGATVYSSWRLAILPEDVPFLPAGFATAGGGAHPLVRGLGRAWWTLSGRRTDRYRYMPFPKSYSRGSTRRDGRQIDFEYGRIPQHFRDAYAPLFGRIAVRPEIESAVARWAAEHIGEDVVGVQVRTWRDDERRYRKYHVPALRRLAKSLDEATSSTRFLVVSDSDEVVAELAARYGEGRVLYFPRRTARRDSWQTVDGTQEDLVDMLLLARVPRLIATYLSTFSEVAWWLGGARADVTVF